MKHARLLGTAVLWLSGCATQLDGCLTAPVTDSGDAQGVLRGSVVYDGAPPTSDAAGAGNTLIFLYAESSPPPPAGSGRPVTFAVLPRAALFGGSPTEGTLRSAPFVIPQVPPGRYSVRAFVDMDGNFDPFALVRSSSTRGDVGGGLVDLRGAVPVFPSVEVKAGEETGGITVTLSAARGTFPSDAPAFVIPQPVTISAAATLPTRLRLAALQFSTDAAAVERQHLMGTGTPGLAITFGDVDGDGVADDSDGDGFKDVYPRVLLRRLADGDSTLLKDDPALTTIPCVVDPSAVLDAWPPPTGTVAQGLWVKELDVLCLPVAVNASVDPPVRLPSIPGGRYAVLLISALGQVWRVPNEYGPGAQPVSRGLVDGALESQGAVVTVSADAPPAGQLSGTLTTTIPPTGPAWVFVFEASAPPPPAGSGRPVASARVAATVFTEGGGMFSASYRVAGLPDGSYLVASLLDQDNSLDIRVEVLAQASRGDVLSLPQPVTVAGDDVTADLALERVVPTDPPVVTARASTASTLGGLLAVTLESAPLHNALFARMVSEPNFAVSWRNGGPSDGDGDGLPDVWPRTLLTLVQRDPLDASGVALGAQVLLASAVDVAPLAMALGNAAGPLSTTGQLRLTVAHSAFEVSNPSQPQALPAVPAGTYALTVLTEVGQVARPAQTAPELAPVAYLAVATEQPPLMVDPAGLFVTVPAQTASTGGVEGVLRVVTASLTGTAYVLLFDVEHLGPPDGAGLPVAVARVAPSTFQMNLGAWEAPYALHDVAPGTYVVQALLDQDGDFSLLGSLRSTGTAGDVVGAHVVSAAMPVVAPVVVVGDVVTGVVVSLARTLPVGPPAFKHGRSELDRPLSVPRQLTLEALRDAAPAVSPNGAVSVKPEEVSFAVTLRDTNGDGIPDDADHDGLPDLYPRVVLQRVSDAAGMDVATGEATATIPVMLDPARYLPALLSGVPAVVAQRLDGLVLPVSLDGNGAPTGVRDGRYATAVAAVTGQAWRVPNQLSPTVALAGGGVATQGVLLDVHAAPSVPGGIAGAITVPVGTCANVVVVVRDASAGADAALKGPAGFSWVRASRDGTGACVASPTGYAVGGLPPGTYVVQAFADVDGDFHPFVVTLKGASQGDLAGGALSGPSLRPVVVENAVVQGVDVELPRTVPLDAPAFRFAAGAPLTSAWNGAPVRTVLEVAGGVENVLSHVGAAANQFTTSTGAGGTWPLVLLARLDDSDPRGIRLKEPLEMMAGQVDASLFTGAVASRVEVVVAPVRVSSALQPMGPPSPGRYAVVVVNSTGQSWQVPNELNPSLAVGGGTLAGSAGQGAVWTVE